MKKIVIIWAIIFSYAALAISQETGNKKSYGVAINPSAVLYKAFVGEVNLWNVDRMAEINIPFMLAYNSDIDISDNASDIRLFSLGTKYRRFFSSEQQGFFVEGGVIYYNYVSKPQKANFASALFGIGFRLIYEDGFFWGCAISGGRAWAFNKRSSIKNQIWGDIDFLKFGYAW